MDRKFKTKQEVYLRRDQISLGMKSIFSLCSVILPILQSGGVLFFDELEKSLHPDALLVTSEDKKSFPDYFKRVLDGLGFKPDRMDKVLRRAMTEDEKPIKQISLKIENITNPLENVQQGKLQSDNFSKVCCVFDYLKNENDSSYKSVMSTKIPDNVVTPITLKQPQPNQPTT